MPRARLLDYGGSARLLDYGGSARLLDYGGSARLLDRLPSVRGEGRVVLHGMRVQGQGAQLADPDPFATWARVFDIDDVAALGLPNGSQIPAWACRGTIGTPLTLPPTATLTHLYRSTGGPGGGPYADGVHPTTDFRFMRANDGLELAQPYTFAAVHRTPLSTSREHLSTSRANTFFGFTSAPSRYRAGAGTLLSTPEVSLNVWRVVVVHFNGALSAIWVNGAAVVTGNAGTNAWTNWQIGGGFNLATSSSDQWAWHGISAGLVDAAEVSATLNVRFGLY